MICCIRARTRQPRQGRQTPDDADLVVRALAFLEGFEAYPVGAGGEAGDGQDVASAQDRGTRGSA